MNVSEPFKLILQKSFIVHIQLGYKYAFDRQCKLIDWSVFDTNFYRKDLIIPRNILKLQAKKIQNKYDKIFVCEKNQHENYPHENKS